VGEPVNPSVNPPGIDPAQAQHPGRRDSQQDACGFSNLADEAFAAHGGHLAVLADGMGGMRNGLWAASHAVQAFIQAYQTKTADETIHAALQRALSAANAVVHDEAQRLNAVDRMGTTLAVAVVRGLDLHWLNVGDSRVYLVEDGHLMCLSTDHSYAEILRLRVHRGELSAGEALGHPLRHALTSYLGRPEPVQHASSGAAVQLRPGARVLLCSDGLTQALDDEQICSLAAGQRAGRLRPAAAGRAGPRPARPGQHHRGDAACAAPWAGARRRRRQPCLLRP
jgi:serine/threonine protein phosphatase PrpC